MKLSPADEQEIERMELHSTKSHGLIAAARTILGDYENFSATTNARIDIAIEFLELARYEIGCAFHQTPPGRTRSTRGAETNPKKAKQ